MHRTARTTTPVLIIALAALATGCGGPGHAATAAPPATAVTSVTTSPAPTPAPVTPAPTTPAPAATTGAPVVATDVPTPKGFVQPTPIATGLPAGFAFTGPAATTFGADRVAAAYRVAARFALLTTYNPTTVLQPNPTVADLAYTRPYLTPDGQRQLAQAVATQNDADGDLQALVTCDLGDSSGYRAGAEPVFADTGAGPPTTAFTTFEGHTDLRIRFDVFGYLNVVKQGRAYQIPISKKADLYMRPVTGAADGWLVDSLGQDGSVFGVPEAPAA